MNLLLYLVPALFLCQDEIDVRKEASGSILSALTATGFKFGESPNKKNHMVLFNHPNERQQTVYITSSPATASSITSCFIYTTIWVGDAAPPNEVLTQTLLNTKKFGYYYLFKDTNGKFALRFGSHFDLARISQSPKAEDEAVTYLKDMVYFVNQVGEEMDILLNGNRDIK